MFRQRNEITNNKIAIMKEEIVEQKAPIIPSYTDLFHMFKKNEEWNCNQGWTGMANSINIEK